jgi:putative transposase
MLIEPTGNAEDLGLLMKRVAGRYTRYLNKKEGRTGTVWEGRYKSSIVDSGEYLLACCRYVEMNPVRAGIVLQPEAYWWSSYGAKVGTARNSWLDLDDFYLGLGRNVARRQQRYRQWMQETQSEAESELIRQAVRRNQLTGNSRFVDAIEKKLGKRIEMRGRGRPKKTKK